MARLRAQLERFNAGLLTRICDTDSATLRRVNEQLLADGLTRAARQPGEQAPDFAMADQYGRIVSLHHALECGPVVLNFYRGAWSPFCELTLRAWQEELRSLRRAGAGVIAIGPDKPSERTRLATRSGITYPVLSDPGLAVADAYRVSYDMPVELQRLYRKFSPELNTPCGAWRLPFPATYLIGRDGLIRHAHLDPRPYIRMEPEAALQLLEGVPA
jgi:peroxiredoxin